MTLLNFTQTAKFPIVLFVFLLFSAISFPAFGTCDPALLKRAKNGDVNAQSYIAHLYVSGKGVEKNYRKARYWYQRVADHHAADAKIIAHANLLLGADV